MIQKREFLGFAAAALACAAMPSLSWAQDFPNKPIHFVVPLAGGGSADLLARLVGQHLSQRFGQPVIVEMRPGGGTVIGSNLVAHANPDGYTVLFIANSLVINDKLHSHLPYNGSKAFEPVALMANSPQVLAVNTASPHHSLNDWLDAARAKPDSISLASLGPATTQHMASAALQSATGVALIYVPFSGGALAVNAVLGGHVDSVLGNLAEIAPHIEAGRLRPLAVCSAQRLPSLMQIPTVAESGYPGFEATAWFGVAAPAGTPPEVIALLADGLKSAVSDPEIRQRLESHGLQTAYLGPAALASHITQQYGRYARLIDDAKISVQ
jgi:tripartite-type tricarboxylate transporter receptor subunit TctC